jgi:hypothetical protein
MLGELLLQKQANEAAPRDQAGDDDRAGSAGNRSVERTHQLIGLMRPSTRRVRSLPLPSCAARFGLPLCRILIVPGVIVTFLGIIRTRHQAYSAARGWA